MDKSTKKAVIVDGKEVQAETKFTADKSSGSVELKFNFDSTKYTEVVVFEDLYIKDTKIAKVAIAYENLTREVLANV